MDVIRFLWPLLCSMILIVAMPLLQDAAVREWMVERFYRVWDPMVERVRPRVRALLDPEGAARERRLLANACVRCGYSLDGNTSGTCPECGLLVGRPWARDGVWRDGWKQRGEPEQRLKDR